MQLFIGLALPPTDHGFPSSVHFGIGLDLGQGLAFHLSQDLGAHAFQVAPVVRHQIVCSSCCIISCREADPVLSDVALSGLVIGRSSQSEDQLAVQIGGVGVVCAVSSEPAGLALLCVCLCADQVHGTGVVGVSTVVLEQRVQLLLHGVNKVFCHDGVAVLPLQVITQGDLVSIAAGCIAQAPGLCVLSSNVFQLAGCAVLYGVSAADDFGLAEFIGFKLIIKGKETGGGVADQGGVVLVLIGQLVPVRRSDGCVSTVSIVLAIVDPLVGAVGITAACGRDIRIATTRGRSCSGAGCKSKHHDSR